MAAAFLGALSGDVRPAYAINEGEPLHHTADHYDWDRKERIVIMTGHATVNQPGETITADYMRLNLKERTVLARGNVKYFTADMVIEAVELEFDLTTRTGSIVQGRMSSPTFTLTGERINKLSGRRYQTLNGTYTTCKDCPQSWILEGEHVDLAFGGYAVIRNMRLRVLDTPILWSPILVFPLKTERQSGVLYPSQGIWNGNFYLTMPFFWAINQWSDMTITGGVFFNYGPRFLWEGRYALSSRSHGNASFGYLTDTSVDRPAEHRWAGALSISQELPWGIDTRIRFREMSDNLYPNWMPGDVPGVAGEPTADSDVSLWGGSDYVSGYVMARRSRNLLNLTDPTQFDPKTVQLLPKAELTSKDHRFFGWPVAAGVTVGMSNFTRGSSSFDLAPDITVLESDRDAQLVDPAPGLRAPILGVDPIRTGTRLMVQPNIYVAFQPWNLFSVVPSLEYKFFYYHFYDGIPELTRGYLQFKTDFTTQIERVYETSSKEFPRVKHLIRPTVSYALIPWEHQSGGGGAHPFLKQIEYAQLYGAPNYYFDSNDIVPKDPPQTYNSYFAPLGNAISYGLNTQLIRRRGAMEQAGVYERLLEVYARHGINFIQLASKRADAQPISVLQTGASFGIEKFGASVGANYYPYALPGSVPWTFGMSTAYTLESTTHRNLFAFQRLFGLTFNYAKVPNSPPTTALALNSVFSINDYIMPSGSISYDFATLILNYANAAVRFQSPAECWYFEVGVQHNRCAGGTDGYCTAFTTDFKMNLTGSYSGVGEIADNIQSRAR